MPVEYWDSIGKGKEGGQPNIGGNDELIDKSIGKNSTPEQVKEQVTKVQEALKGGGLSKKRAAKLRAWLKVAKRGFKRAVCPPFLEDADLTPVLVPPGLRVCC